MWEHLAAHIQRECSAEVKSRNHLGASSCRITLTLVARVHARIVDLDLLTLILDKDLENWRPPTPLFLMRKVDRAPGRP